MRQTVVHVVVVALVSGLMTRGLAGEERPGPAPPSVGPGLAAEVWWPMPMGGPVKVPRPLAPEEEARLLASQRALQEKASTLLGHRVRLLEDDQFIFLSDLPRPARKKIMGWLAALYRHLDRIFLADKEDMRMWDGKLLVVVLARRQDYQQFALTLARTEGAAFADGYFQPQQELGSGAMTASVVVPMPEKGKDSLVRLRGTLVHECTHAFLYFWRRPGRTPLWLHEGTAVHMQAVAQPADSGVKTFRMVARGLAENDTGQPIGFAAEGLMPASGEDYTGYAQALAMTETLLAADAERYVRFIRLMKNGTAQKEALEQSFGWSYDTLDAHWRRYARKEY